MMGKISDSEVTKTQKRGGGMRPNAAAVGKIKRQQQPGTTMNTSDTLH